MGGEWGGRWTNPVDMPHMQFTDGLRLAEFQSGRVMGHHIRMPWEDEIVLEPMKIMLDGKIVEVRGKNIIAVDGGGTIVVSLRDAFELQGARVTWDANGNDRKGIAVITTKRSD
jgi:hypothetical protein